MDNENEKRVYCTNMNEKDPIIEKFMKEYLKEKEASGFRGDKSEDIIVNFDITYADGVAKSYSCGAESPVFGQEDEGCIESKINAEEMKSHFSEAKIGEEINIEHNEKNDTHINKDIEEDKFDNGWICEQELEKIYNMSNIPKREETKKLKVKERKVNGTIIVYSTFLNKFGKRIKGVKINLYKLNGISPQLIESIETDENGRAVFSNVPKGSYRVIELIDKRYFKKPVYINWNEVTINDDNTEAVIYVVNSINKV
ncbi:MAG: prealbumin-like fold domain-containing protein [Clostridium sp.]